MTDAKTTLMTPDRLRELMSSYGADRTRWPKLEREAAERLLSQDPEARRLCEQVAVVDRWLDAVPAPDVPSASLQRKVAEIPLRHPRADTRRAGLRAFLPWRVLVGATLACALGVVSAALSMDSGSTSDDGWDDVTTVAFAIGLDEGGP
jgi:hypothetical protein